ncbi:hypothetical protein [Streptomyces soliscabiei]|uniref:hypothetical protein n=1 Tax=Streptomyces soliscabiei TaxID=588897 RepID=UPI0029A5B9A7|nr:hypothetical protein [Streptomyces sp. NY05-11A]MDX2683670.1 hypothetical protein [Streptomyces sp. NY05-11A]
MIVGIALLTSACSSGGDGTTTAPSPSTMTTATSASPSVAAHPAATNTYDLAAYCDKGGPATLLTGQPAYKGKGPHPVLLTTKAPDSVGATRAPLASPGETQSEPPHDTYHPDPAKAQLIACVANKNKGKLVTTCRYSHNADHYVRYFRQGQYAVTVYEAKTGRRLGTTTVLGDDTYTCLAQVSFFDGEPLEETVWLDADLPAFREALAPWVNALAADADPPPVTPLAGPVL